MFAYITWQRNDKEILIVFSVMSGPETSESHLPCFLHVNCVHPVIARWHPRCGYQHCEDTSHMAIYLCHISHALVVLCIIMETVAAEWPGHKKGAPNWVVAFFGAHNHTIKTNGSKVQAPKPSSQLLVTEQSRWNRSFWLGIFWDRNQHLEVIYRQGCKVSASPWP